ncbi:hypothetical protein IH980_02430 [Patescibacteria group bacterium]|nr:hypothetical protein [Patescibacteria group bacterium]
MIPLGKKFLFVVGAALVLAGCLHAASPGTTTTTTAPEDGAMLEKMVVELSEVNDSGQSGTATIEEVDGKVMVMLALEGPASAVPQPAHIHDGSCPGIGSVVYPLTNVVDGASETTLDIDMETLESGKPLAVNVHKSAEEIAVFTSCGDL